VLSFADVIIVLNVERANQEGLPGMMEGLCATSTAVRATKSLDEKKENLLGHRSNYNKRNNREKREWERDRRQSQGPSDSLLRSRCLEKEGERHGAVDVVLPARPSNSRFGANDRAGEHIHSMQLSERERTEGINKKAFKIHSIE